MIACSASKPVRIPQSGRPSPAFFSLSDFPLTSRIGRVSRVSVYTGSKGLPVTSPIDWD
jgi:hypothetical protein